MIVWFCEAVSTVMSNWCEVVQGRVWHEAIILPHVQRRSDFRFYVIIARKLWLNRQLIYVKCKLATRFLNSSTLETCRKTNQESNQSGWSYFEVVVKLQDISVPLRKVISIYHHKITSNGCSWNTTPNTATTGPWKTLAPHPSNCNVLNHAFFLAWRA